MRNVKPGQVVGILCGAALLIAALVASSPVEARPPADGAGKGGGAPLRQTAEVIEIAGQPLRIQVGADGSLQVYHQKYERGATYGTAGSGFFLAIGQTVYGPYYTQFSPVSHQGPSGSGAAGSPFQVVTEGQVGGSGVELRVAQTVSYTNGNNYFQLDWEVTNTGSETACFKAYHAADLYFADDDYGTGYYDARSGAVGGFNQARDWFMVFIPSFPATHYEEAYYSTIWQRLSTAADLQDSIDANYIDNGAALQWDACLRGGEAIRLGDLWSFGESEAEVIRPGGNGENGGTGGTGQPGAPAEPFRPAGPLTPRVTTYVPTPLDIATDPKVIGANLLLAAIAMLLFTIASEILNRTLAKNEPFLQNLLRPLKWLRDRAGRVRLSKRLGRPLWFELLKLLLIMLVYGFVFSLLDPTWQPFSLTGLYLFVTMAIAYGLVGLADDIAQWAAARRWKVAASLDVRPGNLLLIVASTTVSRVFGLLPGVMFGMPEAFDVDEAALADRRTENGLLRVAAGILFLILLAAWLPTALTAWVLQATLPEFLAALIGGLESFLLLVFAVTVQNIFLQMLALPNTFGKALARWSKPVWALGFLFSAFLYLHTLLNPRGDLAEALASSNVIVFLATIFLFLVFTVLVWFFFLVVNAFKPKPALQPAAAPTAKKSKVWLWLGLAAAALFCLCLLAAAIVGVVIWYP